MGRPKKSEIGPIPTEERILLKALELFALNGFDAVSIRDITTPLGLNQATLYLYYKNKGALLDVIFQRLDERLIDPGLIAPPPDYFRELDSFDLASFLIEGATRFFGKVDQETRLTWRLLLISQYKHQSARDSVMSKVLDAPALHFGAMLRNIQIAELIPSNVDTDSLGRVIAAMFFEYSFRTNLNAAWKDGNEVEFDRLSDDLRNVASFITR